MTLSPARRRALARQFADGVTIETLAWSYGSESPAVVEDAIRWVAIHGFGKRKRRRKSRK